MALMKRTSFFARLAVPAAAFAALLAAPAQAQSNELQASFDDAFGTEMRSPETFEAIYANGFEQRIAELADGDQGRIGVAAVDMATGEQIMVLGDQLFPMAVLGGPALPFRQGRETWEDHLAGTLPVFREIDLDPGQVERPHVLTRRRDDRHVEARAGLEFERAQLHRTLGRRRLRRSPRPVRPA